MKRKYVETAEIKVEKPNLYKSVFYQYHRRYNGEPLYELEPDTVLHVDQPDFVTSEGTLIYINKILDDDQIKWMTKTLKFKLIIVYDIELPKTITKKRNNSTMGSIVSNIKKIINCVTETTRYNVTSLINKYSPMITRSNNSKKLKIDGLLDINCLPKKIYRPDNLDISKLVSATQTHNYILNNCLDDWLNLYYRSKILGIETKKRIYKRSNNLETIIPKENDKVTLLSKERIKNSHLTFTDILFQKGHAFEDIVINKLREKYENKIVTIVENMKDYHKKLGEYIDTSIHHICQGTPIIYQAALLNNEGPMKNSYGICDLLIRSDYLNEIFETPPLDEDMTTHKAPLLTGHYHYVIIDIKWTTLELCSDGDHLRNNGRIPSYKSQLYVYNHALGHIQGYEPPVAFIMGSRWKIEKRINGKATIITNNNCFDRLGKIDYSSKDKEYKISAADAIKWVLDVRTEGDKWSLYPQPSNNLLYPNISGVESPWDSFKEQYAKEINDITVLWNCGVKNRNIAHDNGIMSWKDPRCTAETIGITGPKVAPILNKMIKINQQKKFRTSFDRIELNLPEGNENNRWTEKTNLIITIDFETTNSIFNNFSTFPNSNSKIYIFLIGFSYKIKNNEPIYKHFLMEEMTDDGQYMMVKRFYKEISKVIKQERPLLYHWGHAEKSLFNALEKLQLSEKHLKEIHQMKNNLNWYDLSEDFKRNPIVINGCFGFGLKEISMRLFELGLIGHSWDEKNICKNGNTAMVLANNIYQNLGKNESIEDNNDMKNIIEYNKTDCITLQDIVSLLKRKIA